MWSFDAPGLAGSFDEYVRSQLPFYDLATAAVADVARLHLPADGSVVDLGASTGNVGRALGGLLTSRRANLAAIEPSAEMRANYTGGGTLHDGQAQTFTPEARPDVVVSFLTLAFVPPPQRRATIERWVGMLNPGGALVLVERFHVGAPLLCRHLIHAAKARAGSCEDDVIAKELSIAGVLRPLPLTLVDRPSAHLFFAYGDFRGYVIEVGE